MKNETTLEGLMEAAASGDISAEDLVNSLNEDPKLLGEEDDSADKAMSVFKKMARGCDDGCDEESCDGSCEKHRGHKPAPSHESTTVPTDVVSDDALALSTFESMVDEGCSLKGKKAKKKKKKSKKMKDGVESQKSDKKPILEFAAPERQDVIRWARGDDPHRVNEMKTPFWFDDDMMISANTPIAQRNLEEKTAQVVHPKNLSAYTGRHAVLANHGLRFAGYTVEVVEKL